MQNVDIRQNRTNLAFDQEKRIIRKRFLNAGFPSRFVEKVVIRSNKDFEYLQPGQNNDDRTLYRINLPFCQGNERLATTFIKLFLDYFSGNTYKLVNQEDKNSISLER